jgi:hypothetical protein
MPNANPTSPHEKVAQAVLKASTGLAKSLRTPETNRSLVKRPSPRDTARFVMSESRHIMGMPRHLKVSTERGVKRSAPHSSWRYCPLFSVPLGCGSPGGGGGSLAVSCRAQVDDGHIPHLDLICEHVEDVFPGFGAG